MSSIKHTLGGQYRDSEMVALIRRPSSHLSGCRPIESNSDKTSGFSTRKPCFTKRLAISDAPTARDHKWVVLWETQITVEIAGNRLAFGFSALPPSLGLRGNIEC